MANLCISPKQDIFCAAGSAQDVWVQRRFGAGRLGTAPFRCRTFGYSAVSVQDVWVQRRFGAGRLGTAPFRRRTFGYSAVSVQDVLARPTVENTDRSLICLRRYNCGSLFNSCSDLFLRRGNGAANTIDKHEYL